MIVRFFLIVRSTFPYTLYNIYIYFTGVVTCLHVAASIVVVSGHCHFAHSGLPSFTI